MKCTFDLVYHLASTTRSFPLLLTADADAENDDLTVSVEDDGARRRVTLKAKRDLILDDYT